MSLSASSAESCLFPPLTERSTPVYPADLLLSKRGASLDAELTFLGPDSPPQVRFASESSVDFQDAITVYARQLRVPCMRKGDAPVTLKQGFDFVPNDGRKVAWTTPIDSKDAERRQQFECIVADPDKRPEYPRDMVRAGRNGVVVARVRFVAPDQPPQVAILANGGHRHFADNVSAYLAGMRMPCLKDAPVDTTMHYHFVMDGDARAVLNDIDLLKFLAAVKPVPPGSAYFDTRTMKCPFDVRVTWLQPYESNQVAELEEDVPARHAFLDWMAQREFALESKASDALLGQQMVVHIPCLTLDL